jgi:hypothetical protein
MHIENGLPLLAQRRSDEKINPIQKIPSSLPRLPWQTFPKEIKKPIF